MKVCFIMPKAYGLFYPSYHTNFGGAEVQMYLISKELAKNKTYDISFIVADYNQQISIKDGVKIYPSLNFKENILKKIYSFYKVFRAINANVYVQMTLTYYSWLIALYCKIFRKEFIFLVAHDKDIDGSILEVKNSILNKICTSVFSISTKVISQNQFQNQALLNKNIRNTILPSSLEAIESSHKEKKYHLWIARAEIWKNPNIFLKLASELPNQKFVMVCPPTFEKNEVFYHIIKQDASEIKNLTFIDSYIPYHEMSNVFEKAISFINTSDEEGFPTTFLHATQHGVPIISYNINPNNFLNEYNCGFCFHKNMEQIKTQILKLAENETYYESLSKNALAYFDSHHNISNNIKIFENAINA